MFSGGMDSTYLAWKLLSEGIHNLHIHHVYIKNREKIGREQYKHVAPIISYLKNQDFKFEYSESAFEFPLNRIGFDSDLLLLVAQKICQNMHGQVQLYMGWNPHDMKRRVIADRAKRHVTDNIWKALIESCNNRARIVKEIRYPLIEWNKYKFHMIQEMPKELLDLTWSCRSGIDGIECGKCHACKEKKSALQFVKSMV
jgi:7-cyano-7-deazaguanine synthase in queuosine biosynthesis